MRDLPAAARVLITGATGFVGSHIAAAFVETGHEVRCSVRPSSDLRWIKDLPVECKTVDFESPKDLEDAVEGVEIVVHAAGITRARRDADYYRINAENTRRLASVAAGAGARRFVLIGSLAARGPDAAAKGGRDRPASAYGHSKLQAEEHLRGFDGRMETVALRPAAVYGPRDVDLLPLFKLAARGWLVRPSGPGPLQPAYAEDVARAALAAAHGEAMGFGPFPVAEPARYSWEEVVAGLEGALGRNVRAARLPTAAFRLAARVAEGTAKVRGSIPVFDERRARDLATHAWTCDPSSTEKALGWRAEVPLYEGLERTARWYRDAGWL
ncbi:MAG: UDP-glucose 4-epimerase [uncultured Rubrobacteraceae bacterium]|uniref:UDP-glucose 4-epimerase n=1 Tax=uncultured Rubrobacteraceae bacterium TaxID=349277 RepID=A0A6J4QSY6_9ACTN|nr:MAG: UDP-glucose 4-epimerase [uncultured Rubrobacteraceae bacterium]